MVSKHPRQALRRLGEYFPLEEKSVGLPKIYIGRNLSKIELPNGVVALTISTIKYIQNTLKNLESMLRKHGLSLRRGTKFTITWKLLP